MNEATERPMRWYDWRPTRWYEWIVFLYACALIGSVLGGIAIWIYTGDVYLEIRRPEGLGALVGVIVLMMASYVIGREAERYAARKKEEDER